ncbi:phage tail tube protein [Thermoactinospora rubra]|uniref:phage tail tube protein n=1 Tax=Thermoactinospora rubra TaxID=1088767 RepID=UPI000A117FFC|nr:phage tail tube protein [Thermoactinospora rubra]
MPTGTGLDAQLGFAAESTVGTAVTVTKFVEFNNEKLAWKPTFVEPTGLRVGRKYKRASRLVQSRKTVEGSLELEWATKGMGLLVAHMLGSTGAPQQIAATSAYKQIHTPGGFVGKSLTIQVGRPEPSGTVRAHTYSGCKFKGWEFKLSDSEIATLSLEVDGWDESTATALATASFVAGAEVWNFQQAVLKLGGTASTASGEMSITGGTAVTTIIKEISIKGENPLATERYGIGNSGVKREQLENDTPTITGSLTAEFNRTELYDLMKNNTTTAIELALTGAAIPSGGGNNFFLSFIMPACKLKEASPTVEGPDVVQMTTSFEAYDDEVNAPIQIKIVSTDTAL